MKTNDFMIAPKE